MFRCWPPYPTYLLVLVMAFYARPTNAAAQEPVLLTVSVVDSQTQQPLACRLYLRSEAGNWHYFNAKANDGAAVVYEKQNHLNADAVEKHTTVTAHGARAALEPGKYTLVVERGKTYLPVKREVALGSSPVDLLIPLTRWADPASKGWYSGDTHLHRTVDELRTIILAEDLNVAFPLTNWVTTSATPPLRGNKNLDNIPDGLIEVDREHVIWPLNTEYEIFSVAGQRHTLGALFVLRHKQPLTLGVPPWRPVVDDTLQAEPEVLFDMDKLDWPFAMLLPTLASRPLYELANNHVWRTRFAFRDWNTAAPSFMQPPFGRQQGGHRAWIDYTLQMYYALLNCGLELPPSAGTANGVHPVPAGFGRVYVHLPGGFDFEQWCRKLKEGRSFVSTGPMMYATADGFDPGHRFRMSQPGVVQLEANLESSHPLAYGELVFNGQPVRLLRPQNQKSPTAGYNSNLQWEVPVDQSGWFALRFWQFMDDGQTRFVHSAPWYVKIGDQPVAIRVEEKQYLVGRMEQEIERSRAVLDAEALSELTQAADFYRNLPTREDMDRVKQQARPLKPDDRQSWLDNMIVDHRFTPHEVRAATGMSLEEATHEVHTRAGRTRTPGVVIRPYPGGRHPRRGFLDGAINPQRETKVSIFTPWEDGGYAVVDVPEAIFSNLGLTYLAHTHIPTIWDERQEEMVPLEWQVEPTALRHRRDLPNGISFESTVVPTTDGARMSIRLTNGTQQQLTNMRVQICTMLKGLVGFELQESPQTVEAPPLVAIKSFEEDRWLITAWSPNHRVWSNPPVPCVHSDPIFPDCDPGDSVEIQGQLWFYEGQDIDAKIAELAAGLAD